jgi:biotin synthase
MQEQILQILEKGNYSYEDLIRLLSSAGEDKTLLFTHSKAIKAKHVGNKVYFRGLIEYSNRCSKNCYYCGIRGGNKAVNRYQLPDHDVLEAAKYAWENNYASIVIQAGERSGKQYVKKIEELLKKIHAATNSELHVTLSLGEQSADTYRRWYEAGAHRYLLRIEVSNELLYKKLHPDNSSHSFRQRIAALYTLREVGFQIGTGVMIGLPFQTLGNLAEDLIFFREMDIDMAGMGPYIEHAETPLYQYRNELLPLKERFELALKMVAILRSMMKNINIAATTAMQTIDPQGREKALMVGANVIMPNLTPVRFREGYLLYENKPCLDEEASECKNCLEARIKIAGDEIAYGEWGDSKHFRERKYHREL